MKKASYLILVVLLLSAAAKAQTGWITQKVDDRVAVKFPVQPQKQTKNGTDSYIYTGQDSLLYSAGVIDFKAVMHADSAALVQVKDTQLFADGLKKGMAAQKPNYTFGDITMGKWKTYTTYHVAATENANKYKAAMQMILIGSRMYVLTCRVPASLTTKNDEVFLNSIELLK